MILGLSGITWAAPIHDMSLLNSITFWETSGINTPYTFGINSPQLLTRLSGELKTTNCDFAGVPGLELYDVFYSNANGVFNPAGKYVTVEAQWPDSSADRKGAGLNIAEVFLNFTDGSSLPMNHLESFLALGSYAQPSKSIFAVDGHLNTTTYMGSTSDASQRLRLTLGYNPPASSVPVPSSLILIGSGIIGLLGLKRREQ